MGPANRDFGEAMNRTSAGDGGTLDAGVTRGCDTESGTRRTGSFVSGNSQVSVGIQEGAVLAGKYRVDRVLGYGGMGVVVAAHHLQLDSRVAIKFLLPETLSNTEAVTRFAREARAAVRIHSEHVAKVTDVGTLENGAPYMVMEYLDGTDLAGWLHKSGFLAVDQAMDFVLQASEAIAEAHSLGIVHRDLKPANLFVIRRPDGAMSVKVLDFGISKMPGTSAASSDMTRTSAVMGSPLYMSPEQLHSAKDADTRSDIWSLGVILYELLTAELPFVADSLPGLVAQILSTSPTAVKEKRPDVPPGLDDVIRRCLEKDRAKRFQTIGEFAAALAPFSPMRSKISLERISGIMRSSGMSGTALATAASSDPAVAAGTGAGTVAAWEGNTRTKGRGRWFVAASVGALAAIGVTAAALQRRSPSHAASASPESELSKPSATVAPPGDVNMTTHMVEIASAPKPNVGPTAPSSEAIVVAPTSASIGKTTSAPGHESNAAVKPAQPRTSRRASPVSPAAPASQQAPASLPPTEPRPAAQPAATTKPGCNPNFYYDANGHKHFKPECF